MKHLSKTLYVNAHVVTMDPEFPIASAILCAGGQIEAVGTEAELRPFAGAACREVDMAGRVMYPGFIDSHSHIIMYAAYKKFMYCGGLKNIEELLSRLKTFAQANPDAAMVVAYGLDDTALLDQRGPLRAELDTVDSTRPIFVVHISGHAGYANTLMLKFLDIDPQKPVVNIDITVDEQGLPTGRLTELVAMDATSRLPSMDLPTLKENLLLAIADYNAQGLTGTLEGGIGLGTATVPQIMQTFHELEADTALNIRTYLPIFAKVYDESMATGCFFGKGTRFVQSGGMKTFLDGSIQAYTASLLDGYYHDPDLKLEIIGEMQEITDMFSAVHASGKQIFVHGNGDGAVEAIIQAVEEAQRRCPRKDPRHILVHCQVVSDAQLERMKAVGLWPTFFALHVWNWGDRHEALFLGPERAARLDPCGSAVRLGLPFSLHADTPILPQMTMRSIHTAVNRETKAGKILGAEQCVAPIEAMKAYTTTAAAMSFTDDWRGAIKPGYVADFAVLDNDPCAIEPMKIKDISILATICDNRFVYDQKGTWAKATV